MIVHSSFPDLYFLGIMLAAVVGIKGESFMNSKAVALFLSLGLTATLAACNGADAGGQEEGTTPTEPTPTEPTPTEQGGEEGGDSSALPSNMDAIQSAQADAMPSVTWVASEPGEPDDQDESSESSESGELSESGESGESVRSAAPRVEEYRT